MPVQAPAKPFKIYRSSAGSGKTYALTREYLSLALQSPDYFRSILAVTFTNKATQEMKSRIIETLHELASGQPHSMRQALMEATGLEGAALTQRATEVLSSILHNYAHFSVSTIDSFFQRIIRSFAKEIGLRAGFKVELDQQKVLDDLIDRVLAGVGTDKHLTRWLTQFAEEQIDEGKSWDIRRSIRSLAGEIFTESYKQHEKGLQRIAQDEKGLLKVLGQLKDIRLAFENSMEELGRSALQFLEQRGLRIDDFAYGKSGPANYFTHILKENGAYAPGKRVLEVLEDPQKWASKSNKQRDYLISAALEGLSPRLQQAVALYEKEYEHYLTAKEVLRFIYTLGILAHLTAVLSKYREDNDLLLISDAAVFLKDIIGQDQTPFIFEKTGTRYQHFLIDEFQDTSGFQWDNFRPLIENSVASGNLNLVVGDIKQSIYRWRGGDWKLLLKQIEEDIGPQNTQHESLNYNRRSCRTIIDFNNSLFYQAAWELKAVCESKIADTADEMEQTALQFYLHSLAQAYSDVFQIYPDDKSASPCGLVQVNFLQADEEEGAWKQQAQQAMLASVRELQDKGYSARDIALLVRSNREGQELASVLMQAEEEKEPGSPYNYRVISSDSLFVGNAASVGLLLNVLRYLHNPQNAVARTNMAYDYQRYILKPEALDWHQLFLACARGEEALKAYLPPPFLQKQVYLTKLPLYEMVESLIDQFRLNELPGEWGYLQAFQDAVLHYSGEEKGDIDTFLNWWAETGYKRTVQVSDSLDAIRIYTVHTSKGLQFRAVLMPYCQWELNHKPNANNFIWARAHTHPLQELEALPVKYSARLEQTHFREQYYRELIQAYLDNLNLLYVAFTRAEEVLRIWSPLPAIPKGQTMPRADHVNGMLYRLLSGNVQTPEAAGMSEKELIRLQAGWQPEGACYQTGELQPVAQRKKREAESSLPLQHYLNTRWRSRLTVRRRNASLVLATDEKAAARINWSRTLHALLRQIRQPEELERALENIYYEGMINRQELPAVRSQMEALFRHPVAGQWFEPHWEIRTELPLLSTTGYLLRPDRVITSGSEAHAIDFRVEKPSPAHARRVRHYLQLLRRMGFSQVLGWVYYLDSEQALEVGANGQEQLGLGF
ncbi:UvrD-helicase domain-containing protein [Cesiribacter andamanensis]|uniref:DNA 3'-5' helicase n=1 Tax=Cesiribacter andamanensis AMV16 TaxID=1279009 RepID=M7NJ58_9BACT|nr:UvrD-helicase domain-containing protein [Cesiribacter andamanensis]EMR01790.1 ATP-dependent helicase/nuclease subunit A [Cesiribacter andamanensis AMV16]